MPPSTRREVRLSASLPGPSSHNGATHTMETSRSTTMLIPNMESILENFEHFKRKHISQNREIIKANAGHHLRIRELENRIQTLEAEKIQKDMETVSLTAQVSQLHRAIASIHLGWEAIGRGLTLSAGRAFSSPSNSKTADNFTQLPASNRVTVDPNPTASAVVRSVARPPEGHLESLKEEHPHTDDDDCSKTPLVASDGRVQPAVVNEPYHDDWQQHFEALRAAQSRSKGSSRTHGSPNGQMSLLDMDGAPSPMGSPELPMHLEGVIAAASSRSASRPWSLPLDTPPMHASDMPLLMQPNTPDEFDPTQDPSRQSLRRSGRKSNRRQSGYFPHNGFNDADMQPQSPESNPVHSDPAPRSEPYLPSETNSEAMDGLLVYRGGDRPPELQSSSDYTPSTLVDITNVECASPTSKRDRTAAQLDTNARQADVTPRKANRTASDSVDHLHTEHSGISLDATQSEARTPGGRKRKVPNHEPHDPMPTPARLFSAAIDSTPSAPASRAMDDESEPHTGRTRRVRKSINYALPKLNTKMRKPDPSDLVPASTPHRSNGTTPASARGMVGSTGNLSDIRKLHEAAALRQSPAERASNLRSKGSPSHANADASRCEDENGVRMADLFEIRQSADQQVAGGASFDSTSGTGLAFWNADGINDTSDDESRVTSNADLAELAELEAAMSDLCTSDEAPRQIDTPRVPQSSMWPSRSSTQMSASSSNDSIVSRSSSTTSNGTATKRPSLRRKTTTLPSRSRQSSAEQAMQLDSVGGPVSKSTVDARPTSAAATASASASVGPSSSTDTDPAPIRETARASTSARTASDTKKDAERVRLGSAASTSTELGNGRPPPTSAGLAAGMKPKQRPASAGAALVGSRSASGSLPLSGVDRPKTFSGTTATKAGLTQSSGSSSSASSIGRSTPSTSSSQRSSLHSALTSQSKATPGQMTPRVGAKGLANSTTPSSKESPRIAGTPILRPTPSIGSLASESSGRSSPALSVASAGSSGTQLSTSTRPSLKNSAASAAASSSRTQRAGTAGTSHTNSMSSSQSSTPRVNGPASSTGTSTMITGSAKPQPARSMPSLRRATDKSGVTSTPRITVRSSSSTLPAAVASEPSNGSTNSTSAASIAASKVSRAISSTMPASRVKDAVSAPMGLGIEFASAHSGNGSAGQDLITLTHEIHQVLQGSSSADPSSTLSSEAQSSSPTSASKTSSDDTFVPSASVVKARRTSRRVSGMPA